MISAQLSGQVVQRSALGALFPFPLPLCSPLLHAPSVSFPWASVPSRPQCPPVLGGPRFSPTHVTPTPALLCHLPVPATGTVRSPQSACIWFPFDVKLNSSWLDSVLSDRAVCSHSPIRHTGVQCRGQACFSAQFSSVAQSCPTLCDPTDRSTPGLPVHHQLPELTQTHVHRVGDAIQPSHPLSSPSSPTFNLSQLESLFK